MAKIAYSKLNIKTAPIETKTITFNGVEIEVAMHLTTEARAKFIEEVISNIQTEAAFINELSVEVWRDLCVLSYYTNLTFTDKQKADPSKLYDQVVQSGLLAEVGRVIGFHELDALNTLLHKQIKSFYDYRTSVYAVLDAMKEDYSNLDLDATEIQKKLNDKENVALLRDVLTKIG